jgi:hypothetical protein
MTNVFGSLNSLIGLLVLILIIAVIVMVVRAVLTSGAGRQRRSEQPVVQQPVVQPPAPTSGLTPGWYPDQNDHSRMRYFDGRVWTSETQPRN